MFSSVGYVSLPSARSSRGPPKVPQGFSVRIINAPKFPSYSYAPPPKFDTGYRSMAGSEPWQKQNWYSRPDTKIKLTSIPRDVPPRSSHFLDINTTDHSSYESNRPPLSNYSIYPSASKDTFIYQQSACSKSENYTESETTSETFTPSSDVSAALTDDSTMTLQSTVTETTSHSSPLPVRQPFPIQIPALEHAQAAVSRTASLTSGPLSKLSTAAVHSMSNNEPLATAARASTTSSSARGELPPGLDLSAVPLSWANPIRRESPPTAQARRDSNAKDPLTFVQASRAPNPLLASSHHINGRDSEEQKDSGGGHVSSVSPHARVADTYVSGQVGREIYYNIGSRGLERDESHQVRRDSDNRESSVLEATSRPSAKSMEHSVSSFYSTRREADVRQEYRTAEPSVLLDGRPTDGPLPAFEPTLVGGKDGPPPRVLVEEQQTHSRSQYPSRRDSDEREESHLRNASALRTHGFFPATTEEIAEARKDLPSVSRSLVEQPPPARRDSDDLRRSSRGTWQSDGYLPLSGDAAVESAPRDQNASTSSNQVSQQPRLPARRDSDESRDSHVAARGEPVYGGARDAYLSAERQGSPRSYVPSSRRNSDERQDLLPNLPSSTSPDTRPTRESSIQDFSDRRESTEGGQTRGIYTRGQSGSPDSLTLASQPSVNTGELRSTDRIHSVRRNSDDRLDSPSRTVPLSSSPREYQSSNRETRPPPSQTIPLTSALSNRDAAGSRPPSHSSQPQPQRRSSDEASAGDITVGTQGVLCIKRNVRWNDNLICPSPILASQRRKGWYNCRGDQLWTNDGSYRPPAAGQEYPQDLSTYPGYGEGWMNEAGVRIDMHHRLIPKQPPRSALKRPQQPEELDAGRNVLAGDGSGL